MSKGIQKGTILPQQFWDAFEQGKYPVSLGDLISYHIEDYANLLEGLGYAHSAYRHKHVINIIAIQDVFHISIFMTDEVSPLGIIDFHKKRKKHEVCYRERPMDAHEGSFSLLYAISGELEQRGLELEERVSKGSKLPFVAPMKIMVASVKLQQLIETGSSSTYKEGVEQIATELKLDPISVVRYGTYSTNIKVRAFASKISPVLMNSRYQITSRWRDLIEGHPELAPTERATQIAADLEIDPVTVASYGIASDDKEVKSEAVKAVQILLSAKHDITNRWRDLKVAEPSLTPRGIAESIAEKINRDPVLVAGYGRVSEDDTVKYEAIIAYKTILESRHEITSKWRELLIKEPQLTSQAKAIHIASNLNIDAITVAGYGRVSNDSDVKHEAQVALITLAAEKHDLINKWRELRDRDPNMTPREQVERLATELNLKPVSVARYGKSLQDADIRRDASLVFGKLMEEKYNITSQWRNLIVENPGLKPVERAERIASNQNVNPITIAGHGRFSPDERVKGEATKSFFILMERKYKITARWLALIKENPRMMPWERAECIATETSLAPITVAGYGRVSPNKLVKYEAIKTYNTLREAQSD